MMSVNRFPPGWDEKRVSRVLEHYDSQTDEEALAEDEERLDSNRHVVMVVPADLVAKIRELIAKRRSG
jgi:hypothetical protein